MHVAAVLARSLHRAVRVLGAGDSASGEGAPPTLRGVFFPSHALCLTQRKCPRGTGVAGFYVAGISPKCRNVLSRSECAIDEDESPTRSLLTLKRVLLSRTLEGE